MDVKKAFTKEKSQNKVKEENTRKIFLVNLNPSLNKRTQTTLTV